MSATKKLILHLCADIGSDSFFYSQSDDYEVQMIGKEIGVENFKVTRPVHGIIANPVCTEFSMASAGKKVNDIEKGMFLVNHCLRVIMDASPKWWVLENPAKGTLRTRIGKPEFEYQPWQFGNPWTKQTALWGEFKAPTPIYTKWDDVPKNPELYIRPGRGKPSLALFHKASLKLMPEYEWAKDKIKRDSDIRSLCSLGFAKAFFDINK